MPFVTNEWMQINFHYTKRNHIALTHLPHLNLVNVLFLKSSSWASLHQESKRVAGVVEVVQK